MGRKIRIEGSHSGSLAGKIAEFLGEILEMPSASVKRGYSIRVTDGREAYITGGCAILSYYDSVIVVKTSVGRIIVNGEKLDISGYIESEIMVRGKIHSVITEEGE